MMYQLVEVPLEQDLKPLLHCLRQSGIGCKVIEKNGQQALLVADEHDLVPGFELYQRWCRGELNFSDTGIEKRSRSVSSFAAILQWKSWYCYYVTILLLIFTMVIAGLTRMGSAFEWISYFSFTPFVISGDLLYVQKFQVTWNYGQYWRLVTPIFLHFGWLHLTFNMLWLYEFGRKIESYNRLTLPCLVVFSAIVSNFTQYVFSENYGALFGGLSGVIYALLGFCWIVERMRVHQYFIQPGIYGFMLIWLIIGYTGAPEWFGFGKIANAAHLAGLLSGLIYGLVFCYTSGMRQRLKR